jgi:O-antigen/teichoic acid export membrane protein
MYVKHSLMYLLAKLAPVLASFISLAAYTRWLSTDEYGVYTTLTVLVSSLHGFLFGWLNIGAMRFWDAEGVSAQAMQRLMGFVVVSVSMFAGIFAAGYAGWRGNADVAVAFAALFGSTAFYESFQRINVVTQRVGRYVRLELVRTLVTLGSGLLLVWLGYSWQGVMAGVVLGMLVALGFARGVLTYFRVRWRDVDLAVFRKILHYGVPLSLSAVLLDVIYTSDRLLLSALLGVSAAGQYSVAYNIPHQVIVMLSSSLNLAAYPVIVRVLEQEGLAQAEEKFRQYLLLLLGVLIPAVMGLVGISHSFIPLLMGQEFVGSSIRLWPWVGAAVLGHCLYSFYVFVSFQLARRTVEAVKVVALGACINVPLNLLMIPRFGLEGAVASSAFSYWLCVVYGYYRGGEGFRMHIPWLELGKVVFAAAFMLWGMGYIPDQANVLTLLVKIVVGIVLYGSVVLLLNIGGIRAYWLDAVEMLRMRYAKEGA